MMEERNRLALLLGMPARDQTPDATIYVRVLNEGTEVFRPVPAKSWPDSCYQVGGADIYLPAEEQWEFEPGAIVKVAPKVLEGEVILVATVRYQR
jgi:hypothetical protein